MDIVQMEEVLHIDIDLEFVVEEVLHMDIVLLEVVELHN